MYEKTCFFDVFIVLLKPIEIVMATNHNLDINRTERLIYTKLPKKNKVGWNRDIDSPRQKMKYHFLSGRFLIIN